LNSDAEAAFGSQSDDDDSSSDDPDYSIASNAFTGESTSYSLPGTGSNRQFKPLQLLGVRYKAIDKALIKCSKLANLCVYKSANLTLLPWPSDYSLNSTLNYHKFNAVVHSIDHLVTSGKIMRNQAFLETSGRFKKREKLTTLENYGIRMRALNVTKRLIDAI
jgi:hypothetical protein